MFPDQRTNQGAADKEREPLSSKELGKRMRAARAYAQLDQADIAEALGVNRSRVGLWETGKVEIPPLKRRAVIEIVAKTTGLPESFFENEALVA